MIEEPNPTPAEQNAPEPAAESTPAAQAAPAEPTDPKERRRQARSRHEGEARPARSPAERVAERAEARRDRAAARRHWRAKQRAARGDGAGAARTPPAREHGPGRPRERQGLVVSSLSLIHISEPTRLRRISYAVF